MSGDEGALWVDHHQEIALEAVFEDWDDIRQLRDADDRLGRRPEEMLVQYDSSGSGDYRTSAATYRRTQVHDGVLDFGDDRFVPSLPLDLFAQCAPVEIGRRSHAVGVVRVSEIHRYKRSRRIQEVTETQ